MVSALYGRLPFVVSLRRTRGQLRLASIAEWQFEADSTYPHYVQLMARDDDALCLTGKQPTRSLDLPDGFWG